MEYTRDDFRTMPWSVEKGLVMQQMLLDMYEAILDAREEIGPAPELIELGSLIKATSNLLGEQIHEVLHSDESEE